MKRAPFWAAIVGAILGGWIVWGIWVPFANIALTLLSGAPLLVPAPLWIWPAASGVLLVCAVVARRRGVI